MLRFAQALLLPRMRMIQNDEVKITYIMASDSELRLRQHLLFT